MPILPASPPKKILITGGRGRLAACIRPHLLAAGREVTLLSRGAEAPCFPLENLFTTPLLDQADTVLHLAWSTLPATSEENIGVEWQTDLPLLFRLLREIVSSPTRRRLHFIFFSSGGSVYGPSGGVPSREDDRCRPIGWYARAKLAAEEIIQGFGERHGLTYTILRVSNPYGFTVPLQRAQGIIPHAIDCARLGKTLSLWGDGSACKDFIHYTDFNRAVQAVIDRRLTGLFNLAYGHSTKIGEMIGLVERLAGQTLLVERGPARVWDVQASLLANEKLCHASGWAPQVSLEAGLRLAADALALNAPAANV